MAHLTILYFARVAETMGRDRDDLDVPDHILSLGALADWIEEQGGQLGDRTKVRGAIDQHMASMDAALLDAREIAFFPPVTGG